MELVKFELSVPKESKEAIDVAAKVAVLVLQKKYNELLSLAGELMQGIQGANEIPEEISSENKADLAAYVVQKIIKAL